MSDLKEQLARAEIVLRDERRPLWVRWAWNIGLLAIGLAIGTFLIGCSTNGQPWSAEIVGLEIKLPSLKISGGSEAEEATTDEPAVDVDTEPDGD